MILKNLNLNNTKVQKIVKIRSTGEIVEISCEYSFSNILDLNILKNGQKDTFTVLLADSNFEP